MNPLRALPLVALFLASCDRERPAPTVTQAEKAVTPAPSGQAAATGTGVIPSHPHRRAAAHGGTPEAAANQKAVAAMVAAFNAHDPRALAALYDPGAVVVGPTPGGFTPEVGREPLIVGHEALFASQPDVKSATVRLFVVGAHAVQEWATVGTAAASGKQIGFRAASVYRFGSDGLVKRDSTYYDLLTPAVQTGKRRGEARPLPSLPAEPVIVFADDTSQERAAARAIRALYAALRAGKPGDAGQLLTDDATEVSHLAVKDAEGRDAVVKELSGVLSQLPNVEITSIVGDDAFGAAEVIWSAPAREGGPEVKVHALHVVDLAGGKIKRSTIYASRRELEDE
jgi:ketosteroid isomerase-like protein